jgi:2,5-dioxopentanoate dehydrogenase
MNVTGNMTIGDEAVFGTVGRVRGFCPALHEEVDSYFGVASTEQIDRACKLADEAFDSYRNTTPEIRANFLEAIADNLLALGDTLYERVSLETGLTRVRVEGETARTAHR